MVIDDPNNSRGETPEEEYEGGDDLEGQSEGPIISEEVRKKFAAEWAKLEG